MNPATTARHMPDDMGTVWSDEHSAPAIYTIKPHGSGTKVEITLLGDDKPIIASTDLREKVVKDMKKRGLYKDFETSNAAQPAAPAESSEQEPAESASMSMG